MTDDQERGYTARRMIRIRDARTESYPSEFFNEHAWHMLLHLFVAHSEHHVMTENDIISLSGASIADGRKWLDRLVKEGEIAKRSDGDDVAFTSASLDRMRAFLDRAEIVLRSKLASLT